MALRKAALCFDPALGAAFGTFATDVIRHHLSSTTRTALGTTDHMARQVEQFRADAEERLATYREIEQTNTNRGHDWYHRHLLELGIARAELDLKWADKVARALRRR